LRKQIVTVCQDIADSLDEGARTDAIITDFSEALNLVQYDRLPSKIAASELDTWGVKWVFVRRESRRAII
jgi:hypothetical protein